MAQKFSNAARAELSAPLSPGDTSLTLLSGGDLFPVANTGTNVISDSYDWFKVVVQDSYGYEIMYVRTHALNGLVLSNILRAQENTTALHFEAGTTVGLRPTAGDMHEAVNNRVKKVAGKGLSTEDFTSEEKTKLAGIDANVNNYEHPTTEGNKHLPPIDASTAGKFVQSSGIPGNYGWVEITKSMVGLDNVNNTSDVDKPVSTAQATAISASTATNIHAATSKTTLADADELGISDSAASWGLKKLTFANLKSWINSLFVSKSGDTIGGNLNFSGVGRRITGDFSNATVAERLLFQTNQPNTATAIGAIPSGSGTESSLILLNKSSTTNASGLDLRALTAEMQIRASNHGAGPFLPLTFHVGGAERLRIDTSGNVLATNGAFGYVPGTGGQVTQSGHKANAVALNKPVGRIITATEVLGPGNTVSFAFYNSYIQIGDIVLVMASGGTTGKEYLVWASLASNGQCNINIMNTTNSGLYGAVNIDFVIIKGVTA